MLKIGMRNLSVHKHTVAFTALLAAGFCLPLPVRGQVASAPSSGEVPLAGARTVSDVFIGRNANGPYLLSWKGLDPAAVSISRGPARLQSGIDYTLDPVQGVLTFARPLKQREVARADYRLDPKKSVRNMSAVAPLQFKLLEGMGGAFSMDAMVRPEPIGPSLGKPSTPAAGPGSMLLGLSGSAKPAGNSQLQARLLLDARGANLLDRGALQISEKTQFSIGEVKAGYSRAGSGFLGARETGIRAGAEVLEGAATVTALRGFQAAATFMQSTDLTEKGHGATTTVLGQKFGGSLGSNTKLQATRTETSVVSPNGEVRDRVASRVQLDHRFGALGSATALFERNETTADGLELITQTSTFQIRARPAATVSLAGNFQNRLLPSGAEDAAGLSLEAEPTRTTKLRALVGEHYTKTGARHTREALLEFKPSERAAFTTGFRLRADRESQSEAGLFGATLSPAPGFEISGMVRARGATVNGAPDPSAVDTYDVKSTIDLLGRQLRLTGAVADNPEDDKGNVLRLRRQSVGIASAFGKIGVEAMLGREEFLLNQARGESLDLKLSWRLGTGTLLGGRFAGSDRREGDRLQTSTHAISLSHRVGSSLDFSVAGSMTRQERNGVVLPNTDYRAEARLAFRL